MRRLRNLVRPLPAWWPVLVLTLVIAATLLAPDVALARGGGGGHSGGGGSIGGGGGGFGGGGGIGRTGGCCSGGGGYSSGGYSGGGGFIFLPFLFGGGGGFLFLIIVLVLIWLFVRSMTSRMHPGAPGYQRFDEARPVVLPLRPAAGADLGPILAADPAFDRAAFLARVEEAFGTLQQAWQKKDLATARPYMGAGLYLSWQTQIDQFRLLGKTNRIDNLEVLGLTFASAAHGSRFDHLTVRVDARAADYEVDDASGRILFGSRMVEEFVEYWTFERSAGATTPANGGVLEQVCPVCGAPLKINEIGDCEYCGSAITSGRFDWVLARIDQAADWDGHAAQRLYAQDTVTPAVAPAATAGVEAIRGADPAFDADAFVQRAEMAFFLVESAWQQNRLDTVRTYFDPALYEAWQKGSQQLVEHGQRQLLENLNVQGVQLVSATRDDRAERLRVEFDAVATNKIVDAATGQFVAGEQKDRRFVEIWTFQRPAGTLTAAEGGLLAHRCPNCGRPLTLNEAGDCASCGRAVTNGTFDWALVSVERPGAPLTV